MNISILSLKIAQMALFLICAQKNVSLSRFYTFKERLHEDLVR
jgi:hypothetical protein